MSDKPVLLPISIPYKGSIATIVVVVARRHGVSVSDIMSARRSRYISLPRQSAMWLARELTTASYPQIGRAIGGRDHSTIIHGCRRVELQARLDPDYAREIADAYTACKQALDGGQP